MLRHIIGISVCVALSCLPSIAQNLPGLGGLRLPSGYQHETSKGGVDTIGGRIWNPDGIEIRYVYGMGDNRVQILGEDKFRWIKENAFGDKLRVLVAMGKDDVLTVTFVTPDRRLGVCNFYAPVRSPEEIAEFLSIVLAFPLPPAPASQPAQQR